jgi:osmotically-inducible protein OsmY
MRIALLTAVAIVAVAAIPFASRSADKSTDRRIEKPTEIVGDAAITARIKADLARDKAVSALDINVDTKNQAVTLSGSAKTREEAEKAAEIAKRAPGVASVKNDIRVGSR